MPAVKFDTLMTLAHGSISGTYAAVGTAIQHNWRVVLFTNNTDGDVIFSTDGVNDQIFVAKSSFVLFDFATNGNSNTGASNILLPLFTQFYVKQSTAPTAGSVYIQGFYQQGE